MGIHTKGELMNGQHTIGQKLSFLLNWKFDLCLFSIGFFLLFIASNHGFPSISTPSISLPVIVWDWWGVMAVIAFLLMLPGIILFAILTTLNSQPYYSMGERKHE